MRAGASISSVQGTVHDDDSVLAKLLAEQKRMKSQLDEALMAKRRLELVEKEMHDVIRARDEALADAEKWQQEALRPRKRGCIALNTAIAKTTSSPSTSTPLKSPVMSVDLKKISDMHRLEVETIEEMRIREFNARREAEQDLEKVKEKIARMEREILQRTPRSNLRSKMDEACTGKGKEKMDVDKSVADDKEKEVFAKEERKSLRGPTKDALVAICDKEGVKYVGVKQIVDNIVAHRVKKAFPPASVEVSEDQADTVGEKSSRT
ncbi:hypothetical protein CBR_g50551 [Chara braunii]|uniref:Uncharacterized protein n=1 Tax=Chara braunii TaxID=69332 RepID=A0A388M778_CHABU|nr:hypothetical protein CBR_g50551 [Chara braunii]|eukprot:GBG90302.1 hypothetical protein CBR_g50551 [Chara braunii]